MCLLGNEYVCEEMVKNDLIAGYFSEKRDVYENEKRYVSNFNGDEVTLYCIEYMVHVEAVIRNGAGIHCRPSAMLIQERATYEGDVMVHSES